MAIKLKYEKKEDIPTGYESLYTEKEGVFYLTGVEGMKTSDDVGRLQSALDKEKSDHKETKTKLRDAVEVVSHLGSDEDAIKASLDKLDRFDEVEARAQAKGDDKFPEDRLNELAEQRVKRALGPVERERDRLARENEELNKQVGSLTEGARRTSVEGEIRKAAAASKVLGPAIEDAVAIGLPIFERTEDGKVITKADAGSVGAGLTPDQWLADMQDKRPHWWPSSAGLGAGGGDGNTGGSKNPWSSGSWNLTAQGSYIKQHGVEKANKMAELAGSKVGATQPPAAAK